MGCKITVATRYFVYEGFYIENNNYLLTPESVIDISRHQQDYSITFWGEFLHGSLPMSLGIPPAEAFIFFIDKIVNDYILACR